MTNTNKVAAVILGAAIGVALVRFFKMPKEERDELYEHIKERTNDLLDNAEDTVEKVDQYIAEIESKGKNEWIDKLYLAKKMVKDFYGSNKNFLL
ncbi:MAG: YtxH domain-containing protein [Ginsengibacter sp.]